MRVELKLNTYALSMRPDHKHSIYQHNKKLDQRESMYHLNMWSPDLNKNIFQLNKN